MTSPRDASPIASNKPAPVLVLASESPRRKALLAQAGIVPDAVLRRRDRRKHPQKANCRASYALRLAAAKARAVAQRWTGAPALVLAADTVVACGRRILPKAEERRRGSRLPEAALRPQPSGDHRGRAAVAGRKAPHTDRRDARRRFDGSTRREIDTYVRCGEGLGKAGGYAIQGRAETFVRRLNGSYSNVVGLAACAKPSRCFAAADIRARLDASLLPEHPNAEGSPDQCRGRGNSRRRRRGRPAAGTHARAHHRPRRRRARKTRDGRSGHSLDRQHHPGPRAARAARHAGGVRRCRSGPRRVPRRARGALPRRSSGLRRGAHAQDRRLRA